MNTLTIFALILFAVTYILMFAFQKIRPYVALIAAIRPQGPDNAIIANQPRIGEAAAVPEAFLRAWLSEGEKDALQRAAAPDGTAYNIRALTRQAAKRTIAVPLNAGEWVLYIEYVAP